MDLSPLLKALEAHTAALIAHTKALGEEIVTDVEGAVKRGRGRPAKTETQTAAAQTQTASATTAVASTPTSSASAATPATTTQPAANTAATEPSAPQATLKQVADAIVKVCETVDSGRDKVKAILGKFNATKVPELKPVDFAAALAAVNALLTPAAEQSATSGLF